ncbi:MAG TPA: HU family DNA-binding protein [Candidatus Fimivivens sp.]|nr:HU family DNA-binding protein [Candidatus Fimivivens sp.]
MEVIRNQFPTSGRDANLEGQVNTMANVNKDALVAAIVAKLDLSKKDVEAVIETMVDEITNSLRKADKVTITGFGTFRVSNRAAREGINPQTKAKITIPAMTVPKFTAGKTLKEAVK